MTDAPLQMKHALDTLVRFSGWRSLCQDVASSVHGRQRLRQQKRDHGIVRSPQCPLLKQQSALILHPRAFLLGGALPHNPSCPAARYLTIRVGRNSSASSMAASAEYADLTT